MIKAIAEIQIIEKVNNQDMGIVVDIFDKKDKIKVIEIADDKRVTVYSGTAEDFLTKLHKDWRK